MIAKSWGSKSLAGVGSLGYHVPAVVGSSRLGDSSMGRATALKAVGCGFESCFSAKAADNSSELK